LQGRDGRERARQRSGERRQRHRGAAGRAAPAARQVRRRPAQDRQHRRGRLGQRLRRSAAGCLRPLQGEGADTGVAPAGAGGGPVHRRAHLFDVINSREDVLRRLIRRCAYLKYVEARLGDRTLYADEILRDGFCLNMVDTPLCPLKVVTNLQEAVWDADIVVNGLPSTETREVFEELSKYWKERISVPVIISLAKGIEASLDPIPRIITPTQMISSAAGVPTENILYLGGPNIASEIYNKEYANARICGSTKWRKPLAKFLRQPHFIVWDNSDIVTHEVMGGLKNVYAIGAGMVAALTNESATSKSVYFAHCTSEMIFITHLLTEQPEKLAGPLLADTYVTLLKGRNAWYGQMLAKGELRLDMGDSIKGKGMIQSVY
uniref:Glycerol-3-phosphate dehydrogenase [NAD(+)] n=1 Tax=Aegilops tauschii subsp. strangulata TaxID=200361 RepID=A0A453GKV5_AEGTS